MFCPCTPFLLMPVSAMQSVISFPFCPRFLFRVARYIFGGCCSAKASLLKYSHETVDGGLSAVESPVTRGWWQWRMKNVRFIASVNSVKWAIWRIYGMLYRSIPRRGTRHCAEMERRYWQQLGHRPAATTIRWTATLTLQSTCIFTITEKAPTTSPG